jgi:tryptophan synthase alpha chain
MTTIKQVFQKQKQLGNGCLIGYVTAGDPTPERTLEIAESLIRGGVDILELGLPFSDPIADGPTIQAASLRALKAGTTPMRVVEIAKVIKAKHDIPVVIMTYYNPVFKVGLINFLFAAKAAGVDGLIVPDLPVEEATEYKKVAKKAKLDTIFLASPATSNERLDKIVNASSGFLYLVSRFGVTGLKTPIAGSTIQLIKRVLPFTSGTIPIAVGFGVSTSDDVSCIVGAGADGVIVGSAFVNIIEKRINDNELMLRELEAKTHELKCATRN